MSTRERKMSVTHEFQNLYYEVEQQLDRLQNKNDMIQQNLDVEEIKNEFYKQVKLQKVELDELVEEIKAQLQNLEKHVSGTEGRNKYKKIKERYNKQILRYQRINRQMLAKSSFQSESIANMDQQSYVPPPVIVKSEIEDNKQPDPRQIMQIQDPSKIDTEEVIVEKPRIIQHQEQISIKEPLIENLESSSQKQQQTNSFKECVVIILVLIIILALILGVLYWYSD
ncbi:hypothetical protein pb186bvf_005536 [Paramecium bursaria]